MSLSPSSVHYAPHVQVMLDIDGKQEWRDCLDVAGVRLPRGYYFGTSAATGDLSGTICIPLYPGCCLTHGYSLLFRTYALCDTCESRIAVFLMCIF